MKKNVSRILALVLALIMCLATTMTAFAISTVAEKETMKVPVKLQVGDSATATSDVKIDITVKAVAKGDLPESDFAITSGIMEGVKGSIDNVEMTGADALTGIITILESEITPNATINDEVILDFTGVTFPGPGVYRYEIAETCNNEDVALDTFTTKYIDVYVGYISDLTSELQIEGYVLTNTNEAIITNETGGTDGDSRYSGKADGFDNTMANYTLTVEKKVSGNQASRTEEFEFEVTITLPENLEDQAEYTVVFVDGVGTNQNSDSIVVEEGENTGSWSGKLAHNQSIRIEGLPNGTEYTVTETDAHGYKVSNTVTVGGQTGDSTVANNYEGTVDKANTTVTFTNTRQGTIPTGILLTIAPFVALIVVGILGAVLVLRKKKMV